MRVSDQEFLRGRLVMFTTVFPKFVVDAWQINLPPPINWACCQLNLPHRVASVSH